MSETRIHVDRGRPDVTTRDNLCRRCGAELSYSCSSGHFEGAVDVPSLLAACRQALVHVEELREAWRTGAISEHDGRGGTRSNRNVEVEVALRGALNTSRE